MCVATSRPGGFAFNQGNRMTQTFEEAGKLGKEFMDSSAKSLAVLSQGAQAIASEASEYTRKSFEASSATFEKLISANTVEKAIAIQTDYAKSVYEGLVAQATRFGELYADLARDAYTPFVAVVAKTK